MKTDQLIDQQAQRIQNLRAAVPQLRTHRDVLVDTHAQLDGMVYALTHRLNPEQAKQRLMPNSHAYAAGDTCVQWMNDDTNQQREPYEYALELVEQADDQPTIDAVTKYKAVLTAPPKAGTALLLLLLSLALAWAAPARAQDTGAGVTATEAGKTLWDAIKGSGVLSATNYAFEPYATYMPSAPKGDRVGGGLLAVYNVNSYVGAGIGVDYLGQLSIVSGNCSLKYPVHPLASVGWTNFAVTPFVLVGAGKPLSGTSSGLAGIADAGAYLQFGAFKGGQFNVGACWGKWLNAGDYTGQRYHLFAGWSKGI